MQNTISISDRRVEGGNKRTRSRQECLENRSDPERQRGPGGAEFGIETI